jgi:cytochrome P450
MLVLMSTSSPDFRLPPGPRTPTLLNGLLFLVARDRSMRRLQRRYGDAYTVRLPVISTAVVVSHPDLVKAIFTAPPTVLHAGENPLGALLGPGSLFSMDEERHLQERRTLLPPFHGDRMRSYEQLLEEETLDAMRTWRDGEEFPTIKAFNRITLRVILRAVFGAEGAELTDLEQLLPRLATVGQRLVTAPILGRNLGRWSPGGRYAALRSGYDRISDTLIEKHLGDPQLGERIDILALMLAPLRDAGEAINRREIADELLTLLLAGHETTSSSLAWTVERLRRHPDVLRRLEQEADGDSSTLRTAVILEVQRTRPVISATGRTVMQPFDLGDWRLPPGTRVITEGSVMHRDDRFHPNAADFDPDRYLARKQPDDAGADPNVEAGCLVVRKPATYAWIPFGGGVRRCIGAAFAQFEMDIVLRTMLRHFELLPTDAPGERERFRGLAFAPAKGGRAVVRRRTTPLGSQARGTERSADRCPVEHAAVADVVGSVR